MRATACLWVLLSAAPTLPAQSVKRGSWNAVSTLGSGERVEVHPFAGSRVRGELRSATAGAITIAVESKELTFQRTEVRVVKIRRASGRLRHAGIGAAIGAGTAGGLALIGLRGDLDDLGAPIAIVVTMFGAAAGFGIGLIPPAYNTIYEARQP